MYGKRRDWSIIWSNELWEPVPAIRMSFNKKPTIDFSTVGFCNGRPGFKNKFTRAAVNNRGPCNDPL